MRCRGNVIAAMGLLFSQAGSLHAETQEVVEVEKASITLNANVNASDWVEDESQLSWALALSDADIIKAVSQDQGKTYNQPTLSMEKLMPYMVMNGVANGVSATLEVVAGHYDWVVLVDVDGDDMPDSYIGSLAEDVQLDQHLFEANKSYHLDIGVDGRLQYRME